MSIKTSFTDFASDIAAFVARHHPIWCRPLRRRASWEESAYAWYAAEPGRHHDYWRVPTKQPIPQPLQEAGRLTSEIERHDATWRAEMDELTKLIEGQKPGEFDLSNEIATADAFCAYVGSCSAQENRPWKRLSGCKARPTSLVSSSSRPRN